MQWGYFDKVKLTLKTTLASWIFYTVLEGFRSFNDKNLRSIDQRAAKLPDIKLWEWFNLGTTQTQADWFD